MKESSGDVKGMLEKTRFSITRLKQFGVFVPVGNRSAWKDKILDYEIETRRAAVQQGLSFPWKDKILDYEIETIR